MDPSDRLDPFDTPASRRLSSLMLNRRPAIAAALVLLAGLVITGFAVRHELFTAHHDDEQHFNRLAERLEAEVARRVIVYRYGLMGTRSVYAASEYVDRAEFIAMIESRELEYEFPGATGIGYIHRIPSDDEAVRAFIAQANADGADDFTIKLPPGSAPLPGAATDDRYIIKYIEPAADNLAAIGLDIGAHPARREAAERTLLTGDACLTGKIELVQDDQKVAGFLYLLPLFENDMPLDTYEQRVEALLGWCYMPLLGPKVFDGITESADGELDVAVFDGNEPSRESMIFDCDGHLTSSSRDFFGEADYADRLFYETRQIEIGGRVWTVALSSGDGFVCVSRSGVWGIGIGGGLLSLLLAALVYTLGSATRRAWALADDMTTDLRAFANAAEQATHAKSAFLANMSHEIRTPMTAILGYAELLEAQIDRDNQEILDYTDTIKRNGNHLIAIINDVLDLSKIEAGKMDVESIPVRPDVILAEVLSLMQVKASAKKIALTGVFITDVPMMIQTDPVRLRQVLVNLVGNAIKFTERGSVEIRVSHLSETEQLQFDVVDTGCGLTLKQSAKLFGAFHQADESTTRAYGGTGLGLHISQRLTRMLGGAISVVSEPGVGSTFTFTISTGVFGDHQVRPAGPLSAVVSASPAPTAQDALADATCQPATAELPLSGLRIFVAEDGPDNQRLIQFHLKKAGAEVTIVENGKLAVEALTVAGNVAGPLADPSPFDLLLCDMQMPEMDGYTAVRLLRDLRCTLPIVALTAHAMASDEQKCLDAGCDAYATKPINREKLIEICQQTRHVAITRA